MILTLKDMDGEEGSSEKDDSGEESIDSYEKSRQCEDTWITWKGVAEDEIKSQE